MCKSVTVSESEDELAAVAAERINSLISGAVSARGRAFIALSGGTTPRRTYSLLDTLGDWTEVFLVDERMVGESSPESNFRLVHETVRGANLHPVQTRVATADAAAREYETEVRAATDRFDIVVLGLGADGHTASLFPHAASLMEKDRWFVATPPGTLPPIVERVTMTLPVINRARTVVFLVAGQAKAAALQRVLDGPVDVEACPASGIQPHDGELLWFVDRAAMALPEISSKGNTHDGTD